MDSSKDSNTRTGQKSGSEFRALKIGIVTIVLVLFAYTAAVSAPLIKKLLGNAVMLAKAYGGMWFLMSLLGCLVPLLGPFVQRFFNRGASVENQVDIVARLKEKLGERAETLTKEQEERLREEAEQLTDEWETSGKEPTEDAYNDAVDRIIGESLGNAT